jgi:hypothetical protein
LLSVSFNVRTVDAAFTEGLGWYLEPFRRQKRDLEHVRIWVYVQEKDGQGRPPTYTYFRDSFPLSSSTRLDALVGYAVWDINNFLPQRTRDFLLLHAGAVSSSEGALLLPGSPDTGKSSLVAALLPAGFAYLSDELGAIDPVTSRTYPFERHITLDQDSLAFFPGLEERLEDRRWLLGGRTDRYVRPSDLGAQVGDATKVRWLVFLSDDREGPMRFSPVPRAEAVELMAAQSLNLFRYQERGVILLSRLAQQAQTFRLSGGSVLERADFLAAKFL